MVKKWIHWSRVILAVIHIADDIDISRGDYIVKAGEIPYLAKQHEAIICWF